MIKLYYRPNSCSLSEHIVLEWVGAEYEAIVANRDDPEYLKLNPKGSAPAMQDDNGPVMTQNEALLQYLAQKFPDADIVGDGSLEQTYEINNWLAFVGCDLHPVFKPIFVAQMFTTKHDDESLTAVKDAAKLMIEKQLSYLEKGLEGKEYLVGGKKSIADAYAFAVSRWYPRFFGESSAFSNITAFQKRMMEDASVAKVVAIHTA